MGNDLNMAQTRCPGCGALVPDIRGPTHRYVPSAPGCWRVFGELQAEESLRFGYPSAHRLVVDAYMAQHPGDGQDRRDRQSVFVHLVALCALLENSMRPDFVTRLLGTVVRTHTNFPVLTRSMGPGVLTVADMVGTSDLDDYSRRARAWAMAVWDAWSGEHEVIREALAQAVQRSRR